MDAISCRGYERKLILFPEPIKKVGLTMIHKALNAINYNRLYIAILNNLYRACALIKAYKCLREELGTTRKGYKVKIGIGF